VVVVMVSVGVVMPKVVALDALPPGSVTVMLTLPAAAIRLAGTGAVSCVPLTEVVLRDSPFHSTLAPERNPAPFTVSVKGAPPAVTEPGLKLVITGTGVLTGKVMAVDVAASPPGPPPGMITYRVALPISAMRLAGTNAVSHVGLTKVVERRTGWSGPLGVTQLTVAPEGKPVPFTVSVKATPPAVVIAGLRLVTVAGAYVGPTAKVAKVES
jgi:hypothetical protein